MLNPGDHLWVARPGYQHHGIYIGRGRVIHFSSPGKLDTNKLRETSLDTFRKIAGVKLDVRVVCYNSCFPPEKTVRLAKKLLKDFQETGRFRGEAYRLKINNCEHFASYCKTGKARSQQIIWLTRPYDDVAKQLDDIEKEDGILIAVPMAMATVPIAMTAGLARYAYGWSRDEIANIARKMQKSFSKAEQVVDRVEDKVDQLGERSFEGIEHALHKVEKARDPVEAGRGLVEVGWKSVEAGGAVVGLAATTAAREVTVTARQITRGLQKLFGR